VAYYRIAVMKYRRVGVILRLPYLVALPPQKTFSSIKKTRSSHHAPCSLTKLMPCESKCLGRGEMFHLRMVLDLGCGTQLLTCWYSALALAATKYRRCYASTFATDHETRLVLFAQKIRAVNLAPSHHHAHRECTVIEAWFYSLRVEVWPTFKIGQCEILQLPTSHR
jgi:hypothetical protein